MLLGFDLLASSTPANLAGLDPATSVRGRSTTLTPTGRMIGKLVTRPGPAPLLAEFDKRTDAGRNLYVDACALTTALLGNAVTANVFMVGVAYQAGSIPLPGEAIERAIELNGTAVEANLAAFRWGRRWVVDPAGVEKAAGPASTRPAPDTTGLDDLAGDAELVRMVAIRRAELTDYQDARAARRYVDVVRRCRQAEQAAGGDGAFTRTVARQLHRLMAYKDEYEVARLLLAGGPRLERAVGPVAKVTWNLHPPALRALWAWSASSGWAPGPARCWWGCGR